MAVASRTDAITSLCVPLPVFLCCNVQVHEQGDRKDGLELNMGLIYSHGRKKSAEDQACTGVFV